MWPLVSLTLRYYRRWLASAWGMALAIAVLVQVITSLNRGGGAPRLAFELAGIFVIVASMVIGIMIQATEASEKRGRLLMTLPVTRDQLAGAQVLAPLAVLVLGALAGIGVALGGSLLGLRGSGEALSLPLFIAAQTGFYMYFPTLIPEIGRSWQRGRRRVGAGILVLLVLGASFLTLLQIGRFGIPGQRWLTLLPLVLSAGLSFRLLSRRTTFA